MNDRAYMVRALKLAQRGLFTTDPNPRVGCVLVRGGEIVGEGWHQQAGDSHAEINALRQAGIRAQGSTCYVTLEPCCHRGRTPPCTEALIEAGVARVVAAMGDPHPKVASQGLAQLREAGLQVEHGLLQEEAEALNVGFVQRLVQGRPWVRCKLAMSLDGATALASGESRWITASPARRDVQRWRARSSAILTGIGTVLEDDPSLNVRYEELGDEAPLGFNRQPLRVILDRQLAISVQARLLSLPGPVMIVCADAASSKAESLRCRGVEVISLPVTPQGLDLMALMAALAAREINELHVECGARLAGSLLQAGLMDELVLYIAPKLMGEAALGLLQLPGIQTMKDCIEVDIKEMRAVGRDWRLVAKIVPSSR
ncbi:bifunctional diaminohydroxyphosphoribosylaminopyrimidine deaminase/5-amino-6-(5-phosphoribosylamino)uracil reductase RibD [Nitrosococcus watsonii]|uniref:Riboflavin biosynthesis protein RibD n=1 Tax=Nitrosococcus watsoni (strain C-113) TaxID=105559 RepID=D8K534_NITWC|nr:bifunctional diaminohydroxyphosphoribosylaminopyrimidine deaminase/5-amino-6-(5-phosphoribosylamino)uracil reductase RibD [Nitrosococcus watsonii]ADJ28011.1 riboflavin biosynthesis protein RibD [Nitrosococcus watsonii C-113]